LASQAWVPLLFSLGVGPLAQPAAAQTPGKPQSILLVTYAVTKAAYDKIIPLFVADWKKKTGQSVVIRTSYGGSGSQTRAVIDGLEADVVALAMASDITKLEKAGLVKPGWQNELPNQSVATNSTVATVAPAELPKPSAVSYIPRPPRRSSSTMASGR
jgi:sulfate transport system substrate-binding protein